MPNLITDSQIAMLDNLYEMGDSWDEASEGDRIKAVNTVETVWRTLSWRNSPFEDATEALRLRGVLAIHARHILESRGEVASFTPDNVMRLLKPYLLGLARPLKAGVAITSPGEVTNPVGAAGIVSSLQSLSGAARLDASAIKNLPAGGAGGGGGGGGIYKGRLPAAAAVMRLGWGQDRVPLASQFTAVGTTDGLKIPDFPTALVAEANLYLRVWIAGDKGILAIDRSDFLPTDSLMYFPASDRVALEVEGVAGFAYPSTQKDRPPSPSARITSVVLGGGPLILTDSKVEDWAKTGDNTLIPAAKLTNAPAGSSPSSGGLNQAQVDARVVVGVAPYRTSVAQDVIDAVAPASIAAEVTKRTAAITSEASTRNTKDVALDGRISGEITARKKGDNDEVTARTNADSTLRTSVAAAKNVADSAATAAGVADGKAIAADAKAVTAQSTATAAQSAADLKQTAAQVATAIAIETAARNLADTALGARITASGGSAPTGVGGGGGIVLFDGNKTISGTNALIALDNTIEVPTTGLLRIEVYATGAAFAGYIEVDVTDFLTKTGNVGGNANQGANLGLSIPIGQNKAFHVSSYRLSGTRRFLIASTETREFSLKIVHVTGNGLLAGSVTRAQLAPAVVNQLDGIAPGTPAAGLNEAAVDARVKVGVADWAETSNAGVIPAAKLTGYRTAAAQDIIDGADNTATAAARTRADNAQIAANAAAVKADAATTVGEVNSQIAALLPDVSGFRTQTQIEALLPDVSGFLMESAIQALFPDIPDISGFLTRAQINALLPVITGFLTQSQIEALLPDITPFLTRTQIDAILPVITGFLNQNQIEALLPDTSVFLTQSQIDARVTAGLPDISGFLTQAQVDARVTAGLPTPITPGLSRAQVDARVAALVQSYAKVGDTSKIPSSRVDDEGVRAFSSANRSGDYTMDLALYRVFSINYLRAITNLTLSNVPGSRRVVFDIEIKYVIDNGPTTFTWLTDTVKWPGGVAPTLSGTNGKSDWFRIWTINRSKYFGAIIGQLY